MGLLLLGEKRTQETHSLWLSSCRKGTWRRRWDDMLHLNMEFNIALAAQWLRDCRQQSAAPHLPGWCICRPQVCSRAWWSCHENQTQSDGYQQKRPRSRHPWSVRQTSELWCHWRLRVKQRESDHSIILADSTKACLKMEMHQWRTYLSS